MSLVIIGSLAFDTIETPFARKERIIGGSGVYCSLAASFFTKPAVVGVVGRDFPKSAMEFLRKRKIELAGVSVRAGKTFHWEGRYGKDPNERTTLRTDLNVFADFKPVLPPAYRSADILYLANINPELHAPILEQARGPKIVAMDTIRYWIENKSDALFRELERTDILFANDEEAKLLARESNLVRAGLRLVRSGPSLVVVKKGEHGVLVFGKGFVFGVPARPCEIVVDPTGAGDSFAGGFLGHLDRVPKITRKEFRRATVFGSVIASFAIEDFGIERFKTLSGGQIDERFREFKKLVSF
jgi:sugar/nucleoside kinase (ribokinase family)